MGSSYTVKLDEGANNGQLKSETEIMLRNWLSSEAQDPLCQP